MKSIVLSLLICSLFAFAIATEQSTSTISLDLFSGSNDWWLAIAVRNANVDTASIAVKDSSPSSQYATMQYHDGWGYWSISSTSGSGFIFPVSLILIDKNGDQITTTITDLSVTNFDTGLQYDDSAVSPAATAAPAELPAAAATSRHRATAAPTVAATVHNSRATVAPTVAKSKATTAPTVAKPKATTAPTSSSGSSSGSGSGSSSAGLKILVPLYMYPDSDWDSVAAGAASVHTVAIINPDSGPGTGPDSTYNTYMAKLNAAGVEMIGYVHTSYGQRAMSDVKADIAQYAAEFPLLVGIFIDEADNTNAELTYYSEVYEYIMSFPGWTYDVINPGTTTPSGYASVATQIVSYEDNASGFASAPIPSFATAANKNMFAMMGIAASSTSAMETTIAAAKATGTYGWVFVTSGTLSGDTYGTLPTYYAAEVAYVASL